MAAFINAKVGCNSFGIECCPNQSLIYYYSLKSYLNDPDTKSHDLGYCNKDVSSATTLELATVLYIFDEAFEVNLILIICCLFKKSKTTKFLCTYKQSKKTGLGDMIINIPE